MYLHHAQHVNQAHIFPSGKTQTDFPVRKKNLAQKPNKTIERISRRKIELSQSFAAKTCGLNSK